MFPHFRGHFLGFFFTFLLFITEKRSLTTCISLRIPPERGFGGCFPLCCGTHLPFSEIQDNALDVEGHGATEMIPVLLDDGREPRLPGSMIFMRDPKVLLNLIPGL